ncbi:hypothetical protein [Burkholderia dolosa]|uniref:hypothetical protein n=1 Tax=Burkholderia dolosa TaxID=152500 RepID=UPI002013BAE7|nr:hypothetical protein [Burkholderia dolosa]MDN7424403.1 hypothetical protein [Burkholderia dolosa]
MIQRAIVTHRTRRAADRKRFRFAFSIRFRCVRMEIFALASRVSGNAFRLRSVTKNRLARRIRIAYIAFHFDTFVACPDCVTVGSALHVGPARNENEKESDRSAGGIQRTRIAMAEAAS